MQFALDFIPVGWTQAFSHESLGLFPVGQGFFQDGPSSGRDLHKAGAAVVSGGYVDPSLFDERPQIAAECGAVHCQDESQVLNAETIDQREHIQKGVLRGSQPGGCKNPVVELCYQTGDTSNVEIYAGNMLTGKFIHTFTRHSA